jgi:hypothetical protein
MLAGKGLNNTDFVDTAVSNVTPFALQLKIS